MHVVSRTRFVLMFLAISERGIDKSRRFVYLLFFFSFSRYPIYGFSVVSSPAVYDTYSSAHNAILIIIVYAPAMPSVTAKTITIFTIKYYILRTVNTVSSVSIKAGELNDRSIFFTHLYSMFYASLTSLGVERTNPRTEQRTPEGGLNRRNTYLWGTSYNGTYGRRVTKVTKGGSSKIDEDNTSKRKRLDDRDVALAERYQRWDTK